MPKSLRLGANLEKLLDRYCAETGETTSHVIRQSVAEYVTRRQKKLGEPSAFDLGKDLFGADPAPARQPNISGRIKELLRNRLREKHHR